MKNTEYKMETDLLIYEPKIIHTHTYIYVYFSDHR